jgi:peptidoglycan hydrolase-like protein with peptidoglycan-binding domain
MKFNTKIGATLLAFLCGLMVVAGMGQGAFAQAQTTSPVNSCLSLQSNLGYGASDYYTGNAITSLQTFLNGQGYFSSAYIGTGRYGSITLRSVAQFQATHGIPATGFVGPLTRAAIASITCGTSTTPPSSTATNLYSVNPIAGSVGTTVSVTGFGFTNSNTVLMDGNVAASNVPITSSIAIACTTNPTCHGGINQTITFTVPSALSPYCAAGQLCAQYMRAVTPGIYNVTVLNSNGTSNTVNFTVTDGTITPTGAVSLYVANPSSAPAGTSVTLGATGLTNDNTILIDGMVAAQHVSLINTFACVPNVTCNTNHQALIFTVPTYLTANCASGQACPAIARLLSPGTYSLAIQNANGTSNTIPFTVTGGTTNNQLSISGLSAPASLALGQQGTWTISAVSNGSGNLHYSVIWGDEASTANGIMAPQNTSVQSSATFTHAYQHSGNYTPVFTVSDDFGHSVSASNTVVVTPLY